MGLTSLLTTIVPYMIIILLDVDVYGRKGYYTKYMINKCHSNAKEKDGTCETVHILDKRTKLCYCNTDYCNKHNGSSVIQGTIIMLICGMVVVISRQTGF